MEIMLQKNSFARTCNKSLQIANYSTPLGGTEEDGDKLEAYYQAMLSPGKDGDSLPSK